MVFQNEADARDAAQKLTQPDMTFEQIAAAPDRKGSDINLGLVGKAQMLDPAIADAAFALQSGQVSEPVKGRFGTAIVKVGKIVPEVVRSPAEAADEIKRNLALERARTRHPHAIRQDRGRARRRRARLRISPRRSA